MNAHGKEILSCLREVDIERRARAGDAGLAIRVSSIKRYQHARFERTYGDLLSSAHYGRAAKFFLEDLYGPGDFSQRDEQFARIVPALVRLFPHDLVGTVAAVAELHALSEQLDSSMGRAIATNGGHLEGMPEAPLAAAEYASAWRLVGRAPDRERQIQLMLDVGRALDRYTRKPLLRQSLKLMSGPAQAAGLGTLHAFLVTGFDTFREMKGAEGFLSTIGERERSLARHLFDGGTAANVGASRGLSS